MRRYSTGNVDLPKKQKLLRTATQTAHVFVESLEVRVLLTGSGFESRGWVSIIVDNSVASSLTDNLAQLKSDLVGDGWSIAGLHTDAPRMDDEHYVFKNNISPPEPVTNDNFGDFKQDYIDDLQAVKDLISADNTVAGGNLKQVILIGHVTVPYSGWTRYDGIGHELRAFPTDMYYADLDASPLTWGDYFQNHGSPNSNDTRHEETPNEIGDSRFDTDRVPGNSQTVTVTGNPGTFSLTFSGQTTDTPLQYNASADDVRHELNELSRRQQRWIGLRDRDQE